jgi:hypothetical protein
MKLELTTKNRNVTPAANIQVAKVGYMHYQVIVNDKPFLSADSLGKASSKAFWLSELDQEVFEYITSK